MGYNPLTNHLLTSWDVQVLHYTFSAKQRRLADLCFLDEIHYLAFLFASIIVGKQTEICCAKTVTDAEKNGSTGILYVKYFLMFSGVINLTFTNSKEKTLSVDCIDVCVNTSGFSSPTVPFDSYSTFFNMFKVPMWPEPSILRIQHMPTLRYDYTIPKGMACCKCFGAYFPW